MRSASRRMDGLAFVSQATRDAWRDIAGAVPSQTIPNGLADLTPQRRAPDGVVRIGFLGVDSLVKGLPLIAEWISTTAHDNVEWLLYGEAHPAYRRTLAELVATLPRVVRVPGRVATKEIFDTIDVLVHASTEFDSYPTVLLEAARASIPVVASSIGGSSEIVEHGQTGFLFSPSEPDHGKNALDQLIVSGGLRRRLGDAARVRFLSEFGVRSMTSRYEHLWRALLRQGRAAAYRP